MPRPKAASVLLSACGPIGSLAGLFLASSTLVDIELSPGATWAHSHVADSWVAF